MPTRTAPGLLAVIGDSANISSIRLHEHFGFRRVGVLMQRKLYADGAMMVSE